jgi:hypothetical protein
MVCNSTNINKTNNYLELLPQIIEHKNRWKTTGWLGTACTYIDIPDITFIFLPQGDTSVTLGTIIILMDEILVNDIPFTAKRSFDACVIIDLQQMATLST